MRPLDSCVTKALNLAIDAHARQTDRGGRPYINHPVTVALTLAKNGYSDHHIAAALLHDVVEDTPYTLDDLRAMGFPDQVVDALALLTHDDSEDYFEYVTRAKDNDIARAVKMGDLMHNMQSSRITKPTERDMARWEKYRRAMLILNPEH